MQFLAISCVADCGWFVKFTLVRYKLYLEKNVEKHELKLSFFRITIEISILKLLLSGKASINRTRQ